MIDTKGGSLGGGEILQYIKPVHSGNQYIDWALVAMYESLPFIKAIIACLLIFLAVVLIIKALKIRNIVPGGGIKTELRHIQFLKRRDARILKNTRLLNTITKLVEISPLNISAQQKDYLQYNLERANLMAPGNIRKLKPEEYNAMVKIATVLLVLLSLAISLLISPAFGVIMIAATLLLTNTVPNIVIREIVSAKDNQIKENFSDYYLMLHYTLKSGSKTPLTKIMRSYSKTTENIEMKSFVDACTDIMDTYGEYEGTRKIADQFREIAEVGKLMRLIRQLQDGGDIDKELDGFRDELIATKGYKIEERMNKIASKAAASGYILYIILFQAILSAMALYFPDLGMFTSLFSG